jgi:protein-S-isoprenylcysteine O-methyltransferase Ste14
VTAAFYGRGVHAGTEDARAPRADDRSMKLPDRSPGLTIVAAAVVVYGTILVEIAMWTVASWLAMFGTLALAILLAIAVCSWLFDVLGEEEPVTEATAAPAPAPAPALATQPERRHARPATAATA